jgi:hypothetical protein
MSALTDLVGGIVSGLGDTAIKIRTAITGKDPALDAKLAQLALELESKKSEAETALLTGQLEINKVEAASTNMFIAGARPALLWVGVLVIFYVYIATPILKACGVTGLPDMNMNDLWPVITGLLGLSGMRTYEKVRNAQDNH